MLWPPPEAHPGGAALRGLFYALRRVAARCTCRPGSGARQGKRRGASGPEPRRAWRWRQHPPRRGGCCRGLFGTRHGGFFRTARWRARPRTPWTACVARAARFFFSRHFPLYLPAATGRWSRPEPRCGRRGHITHSTEKCRSGVYSRPPPAGSAACHLGAAKMSSSVRPS